MDLDLDLSALGVPSRKSNTLGALKAKAAAAPTVQPTVQAVEQSRTSSAAQPSTAPRMAHLAGLDELAHIGRSAPAAARPAAAPAGSMRGMDDLLADFTSLAPPSAAVQRACVPQHTPQLRARERAAHACPPERRTCAAASKLAPR
jgi:hypothetical protein